MKAHHIILVSAALVLSSSYGPLVAKVGDKAASVPAKRGETERKERARRLQQLNKAVQAFDADAKERWEQFTKKVQSTYDSCFRGAMDALRKRSPRRYATLGESSWRNVVKKLPQTAAIVHEEVSPQVHAQVKDLFGRFVEAEAKLVAEFQQRLADQFPELMPQVNRKARMQERKETERAENSMLEAWSAFCRANMASTLPQLGESYNQYFSRMNSRYWGVMRACTEQYLARVAVSNELYRTRLTAFNQAYWSSIERSTARYSAYIAVSTQMYFSRMATSNALYASYLRNSTQSYVDYVRMNNDRYRSYIQSSNQRYLSYIQGSHQAYLNYIQRSNDMYYDFLAYWNVIYYRRLGLI